MMRIKMYIHNIMRAVNMVRKCYTKGFVLKMVYVTILSVLPIISLLVIKQLVDAVTLRLGMEAIAPLLFLFCGLFMFQRLVSVLSGVNSDVLSQKLIDYISELLQVKAYQLDMAYYDNPKYLDTFHRAQQEASYRPIDLLNNMIAIFGAIISLAGVAIILAETSWWVILVMVIAVIPTMFVRLIKVRKIYRFRRDNTQRYRQTTYYSQLLTGRNSAKEMRVLGLSKYFRNRFVMARASLVKQILKISKKIAVYDAICTVIEVIALVIISMALIKGTIVGAMTVGTFVMAFEAFRRGQGFLNSIIGGIAGIYENRLFIANIFEFFDLPTNINSPAEPTKFPEKIETVEWRNVTFRYPDMTRDVVKNYNLKATLGDITRIEGENGFGKSTLTKLLLRLYDPIEGQVLINGIDIRKFDLTELRRSIGTIFQDYMQFYCTLRENIVFGDLNSKNHTQERLEHAAKLAGVDVVAERLPHGYDTMLGRMFDGGEELSMGQWQRVALARQLYSEAPILLFDEPTAWMDAPTREKFYKTLEELKTDHLIIIIRHI